MNSRRGIWKPKLALALLRRLQRTERPDLKLVVMSATLDSKPVARFLNNWPVMRSEGKLFELSVEAVPYSAEPLAEQVASAVRQSRCSSNRPDHEPFFIANRTSIRQKASSTSNKRIVLG
jgi:ATP-dependent helicase HrpB